MRLRAAPLLVATGLWPIKPTSTFAEERLTEPWLQGTRLPTCAAKSKQSGGITGKILSMRFEGISDITTKPPKLQQSSQNVAGDMSRKTESSRHFRDRRSATARTIISTLHGANLCNRCAR